MSVGYEQYPSVEYLNNYRPGGYHPVHLNDTFKSGQYTVVHKLGYGAYATVWLVKDSSSGKYASLKILAANASEWSGNVSSASGDQETKVLSRLFSQFDRGQDEGKQYVMQLLDHFTHEGPNGVHRCIVTELLGPSLGEDVEDLYPTEIFPPEVARRFAYQVGLGVKFLHKRGVVHGDLHLGNLLLYSPRFASWSTQEDVEKYLGKPRRSPLIINDGSGSPPPASPNIPAYFVSKPDPKPLLHLCLDDPTQAHLKICDFSESFIFDPACAPVRRKVNSPRVFRDPRVMFSGTQPVCPTPATDVWALAVLFHMLFTGGCGLFLSSYGREEDILREMVLLLGKLPEPYWTLWARREVYFDDDGNWVGDTRKLSNASGKFLKLRDHVMGDEERRMFEDLLRGMVVYDTERRITADDVVASPWFVKYCSDGL